MAREVIEIPSSPEVSPEVRARKPAPPGRAVRRVDTIIIIDSDEEDRAQRQTRDRNAVAGSSKKKENLAPLTRRAGSSSRSADNIPGKRRGKNKPEPLFLPSDEENEPPPPTTQTQADEEEHEAVGGTRFPAPPPDPVHIYVARVLEIVPDVLEEHALCLVRKHLKTAGNGLIETVIHALFENPTYPRADSKGKRRAQPNECDTQGKRVKLDYSSTERGYKGGVHYEQLAMDQLSLDFPLIPRMHIRLSLLDHRSLYAPTYLFLEKEQSSEALPYTQKRIPTRPAAKGKRRATHDEEFEKEREWILSRGGAAMTPVLTEASGEAEIECGCCFTDSPFDKMIQCPDAHLFCTECMTSYAENLLGSHDHKIICIDQSGCKLAFTVAELRRFLTPQLFSLYERVKQSKEVEAAGLDGIEECPFCEFKCIIENEEARKALHLSCRQCKQLDHLPKSCKEVQDDKKLDARHEIEEAMTRALMRNCPRCNKGARSPGSSAVQSLIRCSVCQRPRSKHLSRYLLKRLDLLQCNKMTCPFCHTKSCYLCRKVITGYDHFLPQSPMQPGGVGPSRVGGKCVLWDPVDQRHAEEVGRSFSSTECLFNYSLKVKQARDRALKDFRRHNPDTDDEHLQVDLPVAPRAIDPVAHPAHPVAPGFGGAHRGMGQHGFPHHMVAPQPMVHNNQMAQIQAQIHANMAQLRAQMLAMQPPLPPVRRAPRRRT
ncbi:unnamed protein product [Mycena citricolor]|uniref:RING-type domain-containing protein n=1 Tax=Mycena citricolor TaxID=2018698 RepID=A0AAD2JVS2_9AGAR|nr:unnamed protein product [Mycena citricolor]